MENLPHPPPPPPTPSPHPPTPPPHPTPPPPPPPPIKGVFLMWPLSVPVLQLIWSFNPNPIKFPNLTYTAHQLCGITPPVHPFFLAASGNRGIIIRVPLAIFKRPFPTPLQNFAVHHGFSLAPISSFLRSADLSSCSKNSVSHSAVCCRCV